MTRLSPDDENLAIDFALGLCEGGDAVAAANLMVSDRGFALAVNEWRDRLAAVDLSVEPLPLPVDSWAKIANRLERHGLSPAPRLHDRLRRIWADVRVWRPAALALGLLVMLGALALLVIARPGPSLVAILETPDGQPGAIVTVSGNNHIVLVPLQAITPDGNKTLEVWTLQTRDRGPVSIGRMASAQRLVLDPSRIAPAATGHLFEITLEPAGGSPTGRPTGAVLMKGLARAAF